MLPRATKDLVRSKSRSKSVLSPSETSKGGSTKTLRPELAALGTFRSYTSVLLSSTVASEIYNRTRSYMPSGVSTSGKLATTPFRNSIRLKVKLPSYTVINGDPSVLSAWRNSILVMVTSAFATESTGKGASVTWICKVPEPSPFTPSSASLQALYKKRAAKSMIVMAIFLNIVYSFGFVCGSIILQIQCQEVIEPILTDIG